MRIGIEANGIFGWRGPSRNIQNLIKALASVGPEHSYYLYAARSIEEQYFNLPNVYPVYLKPRWKVPWSNVILPIAAKKDKIHCMLFPQGNFWLWRPKRCVVILRTRGPDTYTLNSIERFYSRVKYRRLLHVADRLVTVSAYNARKLSETLGIRPEDIEMIPNGVDPMFTPGNEEKKDEYILYVGGFESIKNLGRLLEAYVMLVKSGRTERLVMVGDSIPGWRNTIDIKSMVNKTEVKSLISLPGVLQGEALLRAYRNAKLFVFPSYRESFGVAPLEAMACGCPVVASNASAIPEVLGDAAEYFNPYDAKEMAEKVDKVIRDDRLRESLIEKGRERVKRYSWESSAQKLLGVIKDVV